MIEDIVYIFLVAAMSANTILIDIRIGKLEDKIAKLEKRMNEVLGCLTKY